MRKSHSTLAAVCLSVTLSWAVLGTMPAHAQLISDVALRACDQSTPDQTIESCSAKIASGTVTGRALAAAYSQRGWARTIKRNLAEAQADLDEAIKIDPTYAEAYANRAN